MSMVDWQCLRTPLLPHVVPMLTSRFYRCSVLLLLCMVCEVCAAQPGKPQFVLPKVEPTGGQVASFLVGPLQEPNALSTDFFYVNTPVASGATPAPTAAQPLSNQPHT